MAISELEILRMKAQTFKNTLRTASEKVRTSSASMQLAGSYNDLVDAIGKAYPELVPHLPAKVGKNSAFAALNVSSASHVDIEIYVDQLLGLLGMVEA